MQEGRLQNSSDLEHFKRRIALEYHASYCRTILWVYIVVLAKRIITDPHSGSEEILKLIASMAGFYIIKLIYDCNDTTRRVIPFVFAIYSYYNHSRYIFRGLFDSEDASSVTMSRDHLFRHIIQFSSMSLNLTYICIFLITKKADCIFINLLAWTLFIRDTFLDPGNSHLYDKLVGLTLKTQSSAIILAFFALKFTLDAQALRD